MRKIIMSAAAIIVACTSFSSCKKAEINPETTGRTFVYPVTVNLPTKYTAAGVDVTVPDALLTSLGLTDETFTGEFGTSVKFGAADSADASAVDWNSEVTDGKYGHWFDIKGGLVPSNGVKAIHCQSNCQWGKTKTGVTSFNVNMSEAAYTQGVSLKAYQAVGRTRKGVTDVAFIEWNIVVKEEKPFAKGSTAFSMTTGIVADIKMVPTTSGVEYVTLELPMPDAVYATVKAMSGYDALAYFLASNQIKSYAFPGAAAIGAEGKDFWFNSTGAVAAQGAAVVNTSLYLEDGNPLSGGGKEVKLLVKPQAGAAVTIGTNFKCGFLFVYGTTKIPLIANITVVESL